MVSARLPALWPVQSNSPSRPSRDSRQHSLTSLSRQRGQTGLAHHFVPSHRYSIRQPTDWPPSGQKSPLIQSARQEEGVMYMKRGCQGAARKAERATSEGQGAGRQRKYTPLVLPSFIPPRVTTVPWGHTCVLCTMQVTPSEGPV